MHAVAWMLLAYLPKLNSGVVGTWQLLFPSFSIAFSLTNKRVLLGFPPLPTDVSSFLLYLSIDDILSVDQPLTSSFAPSHSLVRDQKAENLLRGF